MESLLKLLILPLAIAKTTSQAEEEVEIADLDEAAAGLGYQASFSKLGASEKPKEDPVAWCKDPKEWLAKGLQELSSRQPGKVSISSPLKRRDSKLTSVLLHWSVTDAHASRQPSIRDSLHAIPLIERNRPGVMKGNVVLGLSKPRSSFLSAALVTFTA